MRLLLSLALLALILPTIAVADGDQALRPRARSISDYTHQQWSAGGDVPSPVTALAQDRRGYLWLATGDGLFRFDGIGFERVSGNIDARAHGVPSALLVRRNGELWTNFDRSLRFAIYKDGALSWLNGPAAPARVVKMIEDAQGTIWIMTDDVDRPLLRWRDGAWTLFAAPERKPDNPGGIVAAGDGAIWMSFGRSVARLPRGGDRLEIVRRTPGGLGALSVDPKGRIWLTERSGSYPLTGPGGLGSPPALRFAYRTDRAHVRGQPLFDRSGNLWIATYYGGIERVSSPDPSGAPSPTQALQAVESFRERDGLSSNATTQLLQDSEGNIWAGTEKGIDRFRPAAVRAFATGDAPAAFGDLLLRASDGAVYIGQSSTVLRVAPGAEPVPILRGTGREPSTLCEAPDGAIWITFETRLVRWKNGRISRPAPDVPVETTLYDCAFDGKGDFWISAALGGLFRLHDGRWQRVPVSGGGSARPRSMIADHSGRIVVYGSPGRLQWFDGLRQTASMSLPFKMHPNDEIALYRAPSGAIYAAARPGVFRIRDGRGSALGATDATMFNDVSGVVQTGDGFTWLAGGGGIVRVSTRAFDRFLDGAGAAPSGQFFSGDDGLKSRPHVHSRHAMVQGGDGRLWIASQSGALWLDPGDLGRSGIPPRIAIGAVHADRTYRDPVNVRLPAGTRDAEIDFAVINFSSPREVRVRYRLIGKEEAWTEAGARRQAFYTNLSPGRYRFEVIAANQDGIWNRRGAAVNIDLPPTFVESRWFVALLIVAAISVWWLLMALRTRQIVQRLQGRLEARVAERERIARDLHDTLLQSVQGLVLSFQALAHRVAENDRLRLETVLRRADSVIIEARDRVSALRQEGDNGDLLRLLTEVVDDSLLKPATTVSVVVSGRPRLLHAAAAAEIRGIVSEALFNVARHAAAENVQINARFFLTHLIIQIGDDGIGIPASIAQRGHRDGHFGLVGMRERAGRLNGILKVQRQEPGTTVTLRLPGRIAYRSRRRRWRWLPGWLRPGRQQA